MKLEKLEHIDQLAELLEDNIHYVSDFNIHSLCEAGCSELGARGRKEVFIHKDKPLSKELVESVNGLTVANAYLTVTYNLDMLDDKILWELLHSLDKELNKRQVIGQFQ